MPDHFDRAQPCSTGSQRVLVAGQEVLHCELVTVVVSEAWSIRFLFLLHKHDGALYDVRRR